MNYSEKLKDPRWKLKRQVILDRDNNTCQRCHWDDPKEMEVHHIKYTGEPWDAPNKDLITLCETCHESIEIKIYHGEEMTEKIIRRQFDSSEPEMDTLQIARQAIMEISTAFYSKKR